MPFKLKKWFEGCLKFNLYWPELAIKAAASPKVIIINIVC